jgi:hypothetical protein
MWNWTRGKTVEEASRALEIPMQTYCRWRLDYNHRRRHSALGYQTPTGFAASRVLKDSAALHPPDHGTTTGLKLSHSGWCKIWVWVSMC